MVLSQGNCPPTIRERGIDEAAGMQITKMERKCYEKA